MKIRSLGYRTDLIFPRFEGHVADRGDYLVVETPSNPGFFWGNLLIFPSPPTPADHPQWKELFRREFVHSPMVKHITFAWDGTTNETGFVAPFVSEGFEIEQSVVMTANKVTAPKKYSKNVVIRPLKTEKEWTAATENQILCRSTGFELNSYTLFKQRQMARYRRMSEAGLGHWFGAYLEDRLVADLGIYRDEEIGRFQVVETHPDFRRQGICGALVHQASEYAFKHMAVETLVMVADPDDHPSRIYASVGFEPTEACVGMYWWERKQK